QVVLGGMSQGVPLLPDLCPEQPANEPTLFDAYADHMPPLGSIPPQLRGRAARRLREWLAYLAASTAHAPGEFWRALGVPTPLGLLPAPQGEHAIREAIYQIEQ